MSEELKVNGTIKVILPIQNGTSKAGKEWQKLDFVIETGGEYPKMIAFTLFGDKVNLLEGKGIGQNVDVSFNVESREFDGRWYSNINAWRVVGNAPAAPDYTGAPMNNGGGVAPAADASGEPVDDLPF